jgi:hypothetical protein
VQELQEASSPEREDDPREEGFLRAQESPTAKLGQHPVSGPMGRLSR